MKCRERVVRNDDQGERRAYDQTRYTVRYPAGRPAGFITTVLFPTSNNEGCAFHACMYD